MDPFRANVAKLVDALDLGSSGVTLGSSSLPIRTSQSAILPMTLASAIGWFGLCPLANALPLFYRKHSLRYVRHASVC